MNIYPTSPGLLGIHYDKTRVALYKEMRAGIYVWAKGVQNFIKENKDKNPFPKRRFSCEGKYGVH